MEKPIPHKEEKVFLAGPRSRWNDFIFLNKVLFDFIKGLRALHFAGPCVTVFGSARFKEDHAYYTKARAVGAAIARNGFTVLTGGGPGIMEAADRGAFEAGAESVGLNIQLPIAQRTNKYVKNGMGFHYFFTRKVMLSASAQAYVFFPGGFGTLDEMTEMVTLVQTGKIPKNVPVILFGKKFWQPFLDWVKNSLNEEHRYVEKEEIAIMRLVDTVEEAVKIIEQTTERPFG